MKREEIEKLLTDAGITDTKGITDSIMAMNGADITAVKTKFAKPEEPKSTSDEDLKKQIEELTKKHEAELAEIAGKRHNSALTRAIKAAGAKNPKAIRALLDESKLKFSDDDEDAIEGLKEQLETINKSDGYLFDTPANRAPEGTGGASGGNAPPPKGTAGDAKEVPPVI